jgi:carbon storage regulator
MLILASRVGEAVMIGNDVVVAVVGVKGKEVRIGVRAPKSVPVHREEVLDRIQPGTTSWRRARTSRSIVYG